MAGIAVLFHWLKDKIGIAPFIFVLALLALSLPFGLHTVPAVDVGLGSVAMAYTMVVPCFVPLVLLLYSLNGRQNAIVGSLLPLLGGVLVLVATAVPGWPSGLPVPSLPFSQAMGAFVVGAGLTLGALTGLAAFEGMAKLPGGLRVITRFLPASLVGITVAALASTAGAVGQLDVGQVAWPALVLVPFSVGLTPTLLSGWFSDHRTAGLGFEQWEALVNQPVLGAQRDQPSRAEVRFKEGLSQGKAHARDHVALSDHAPTPAYLAKPTGEITYANTAFLQLLERTRDQVVGHAIPHLFAGQDAKGRPKPRHDAAEPGEHEVAVTTQRGAKRTLTLLVREGPGTHRLGHVTHATPAQEASTGTSGASSPPAQEETSGAIPPMKQQGPGEASA